MTSNQIAYHQMMESRRHNKVNEEIQDRAISVKAATDKRGQNMAIGSAVINAVPKLLGNAVTGVAQAVAGALI